jgi:hypothetical protein
MAAYAGACACHRAALCADPVGLQPALRCSQGHVTEFILHQNGGERHAKRIE